MKYFTFVLSEKELNHLFQVFKDFLVENTNEHIYFSAIHNNVEVIGYKSGKLLLRGKELKSEIILIKKLLNRKDYAAIGSDEVGTGDLFGPIVVCAAFASEEDIDFLESLNVRDSKSVNDAYIIKNAPLIAKRLTHSLIILNPTKYNKLIDDGYNLNKIKALLHNQAIVSLSDKIQNQAIPIIIDQFCQPHLYFNYLKDEILVNRDVQFYTKAESVHISVAAAAIIARYAFLYSLQNYGKKLDLKLVKGASKSADDQLSIIIEKFGAETVKKIAKTNFKNVTRQGL